MITTFPNNQWGVSMPKIRIAEPIAIEKQLNDQVENASRALINLRNEITEFTALQSFSGDAADSIRTYFKEVHLTLIRSMIQAGEALQQEYKKMLRRFASQVDHSEQTVIRSEHLSEVHKELQSLKNRLNQLHSHLVADVHSVSDIAGFNVPSSAHLADATAQRQRELAQLRERFTSFASGDYTGEVMPLLTAIEQAMTKIKKDYSPNLGTRSFYHSGAFMASDDGKALVAKTKITQRKVKDSALNTESSDDDPFSLMIDGAAYASSGLPAAWTMMKGLKFQSVGNHIKITGGRKNLQLYLDRYGKSKTFRRFNTNLSNGQHISIATKKIKGKIKMTDAGINLIRESSQVRNYLNNDKLKVFGSEFRENVRDTFDFSKNSWKSVGTIGKIGKGLGVAGLAYTVYSDFNEYSDEKMSTERVLKTTADIGVDVAAGAGAAAYGAAIGSLALGPLGTVIGACAGLTINYFINHKFGEKSLVDRVKDSVHYIGKSVASWFK